MKQLAHDGGHPTEPYSEYELRNFRRFVEGGGPRVFLSNRDMANDAKQPQLTVESFRRGGAFDFKQAGGENDSWSTKQADAEEPTKRKSPWERLRDLCLILGPDRMMKLCAALCSEEGEEGQDEGENAPPLKSVGQKEKLLNMTHTEPMDEEAEGFGPREVTPLAVAEREAAKARGDAVRRIEMDRQRGRMTRDAPLRKAGSAWNIRDKSRGAMDGRNIPSFESLFPNASKSGKTIREALDSPAGTSFDEMFPNARRIRCM